MTQPICKTNYERHTMDEMHFETIQSVLPSVSGCAHVHRWHLAGISRTTTSPDPKYLSSVNHNGKPRWNTNLQRGTFRGMNRLSEERSRGRAKPGNVPSHFSAD
ncbi:hypothetical protein J6590_061863 [Homalodisca vitripennis]|nr:hypothetical protein J6590_061863 [Homalodisca vitripennis]